MVDLAALYDPEEEQRALYAILSVRYDAIMRGTHALTMDNVPGVPIERLPLTQDAINRALAKAAQQVVRIDETTQVALAELLRIGVERGYSAWEMANGVPADNYAGIDGLFQETWAHRAETVSRTELATALNFSSLDRYAATGQVDRVRMVEHTDTDGACAARNGQTVPLSEQPGLLHPNCRLGLVPVLREAAA